MQFNENVILWVSSKQNPWKVIFKEYWLKHIIMAIHDTLNHYLNLVTRQYIEKRVYFIFCSKSFDMDLCPLPFGTDSDKMYHFISERFDDNSAYVQEQALQWLQVCNLCIYHDPFNGTKVLLMDNWIKFDLRNI